MDTLRFIEQLRALLDKARQAETIPLQDLVGYLEDEAETLQMCADDGEKY